MKSIYILLCLFLLTACASPIESEPAPQRTAPFVNYAGNWELDYNLTERPEDKLRWLYEVTRSQMEQKMKSRGDNPGGQAMVDRALNDLQGVIRLGSLANSISSSTILEIEQAQDHIVVKRDGNFSLNCDFFELPEATLGQEWCGVDELGQLHFVTLLPEGLTISHRLVLAKNRERLNIATTVRTRGVSQAFTVNQVFMPYEPGESLYKCEYSLEKKKTCWLSR